MKKELPTSHDYAKNLQLMAEWLLSHDAFQLPGHSYASGHHYFHFCDKEPFLACAKSLGSFKKDFTDSAIKLNVELPFGDVAVEAPRNLVCRMVRAAEYDCEPLLSPDDEKQLTSAGGQ